MARKANFLYFCWSRTASGGTWTIGDVRNTPRTRQQAEF